MKNSKICPKCQSHEIIQINGTIGTHGAGNNIPAGFTVLSSVSVTRYLCTFCGFSEEWIDDPKDIEKLKKYYLNRQS